MAQKSEHVRRFIEETGLPFNILVDESRDVLKAYGVWHRLGFDALSTARPALFVIGQDRTITCAFVADKQHEFPGHEQIVSALGGQG